MTNLASAICPANHPSTVTGDTSSVANSLNVACPGAAGADSFYNLNPIAIAILQLKLPNGQFAVPASGCRYCRRRRLWRVDVL